jgi:hypothetical protein
VPVTALVSDLSQGEQFSTIIGENNKDSRLGQGGTGEIDFHDLFH